MEQRVVWPGGAYVDFSQVPAGLAPSPYYINAAGVSADGARVNIAAGLLSSSGEFDPANFLYMFVGVRQFNPVGSRNDQGFDRFEWASVLSCSSDVPEIYCCNLSIPEPLSTGARDDNVIQVYCRSPDDADITPVVNPDALIDGPGARVYMSLRRFRTGLNG